MSKIYSKIISTGGYLPEKILTNYDIEKIVDTSHDWIVERTGIFERHIASDDESSVDMAFKASLKALKSANLQAKDIDMMEKLGIYECSPEDFALCSFVCQSKVEVSQIIEEGLNLMEQES